MFVLSIVGDDAKSYGLVDSIVNAMRVSNRTHYETADLKRLFLACSRKVKTGSSLRKKLHINVEHSKTRWSGTAGHSGCAYLYGGWVKVRLPKNPEEVKIPEFAWVVCHELLHSQGKTHVGMGKSYYRFWERLRKNPSKMEWANSFTIKVKVPTAKPIVDVRVRRFELVSQRLSEKEKQFKRLTLQIRKLRVKEKYYQKALAPQ